MGYKSSRPCEKQRTRPPASVHTTKKPRMRSATAAKLEAANNNLLQNAGQKQESHEKPMPETTVTDTKRISSFPKIFAKLFPIFFDLLHLPSCLKLRSTTGTSSRMNTDSVFVEICSQIIGMVP